MDVKPSQIEYADKNGGKKTPQIAAAVIAVVAAGVSIWGINSNGLTAGISLPSPPSAPPVVSPPSDDAEAEKLAKEGARLHQEKCAGCHTTNAKLIGPSYASICRKYGESVDIPGNPPQGVTDQIDTTVLSSLSFAITHPQAVWDGYEQGPQMTLSSEERRAIAYWIFKNSSKADAND